MCLNKQKGPINFQIPFDLYMALLLQVRLLYQGKFMEAYELKKSYMEEYGIDLSKLYDIREIAAAVRSEGD